MFETNPTTGITRDKEGNLYPLKSYYYIPEFGKVIYCHDVRDDKLLLGAMTNFISDAFTNITRQVISLKDFWSYQPIHLSTSSKRLNSVGEWPFLIMHEFSPQDHSQKVKNDRGWESYLPKATKGGFLEVIKYQPGQHIKIYYHTGQNYTYVVTSDYKFVEINIGTYIGGSKPVTIRDSEFWNNNEYIEKGFAKPSKIEIVK